MLLVEGPTQVRQQELRGGPLPRPLDVLGGRNRIAVEAAPGCWEVIGFTQAVLDAPGRYQLSGLLRGLGASEAQAA